MLDRIKKGLREKLLYKIVMIFLVLSLGSLIFVGLQLISTARNYIQKEIVKTHVSIAKQFSYNFGWFMQNALDLLTVAYRNESMVGLMDAYPIFDEISFYTMDGERKIFISKSSNGNSPLPNMAKVTEEIKTDGIYAGSIHRSANGHPIMQVAVSVRKQAKEPIGFLVSNIDLIELSVILEGLRIGDTGIAYVVNKDRQLIAHSNVKQLIENKMPGEIDSFLRSISNSEEAGYVEFRAPSGEFLGAYAPMENLGWMVLVQLPIQEAYKVSREMRNKILFFILLVGSFTILLGVYFTGRIVKPIKTLQIAMDKVAKGNMECQLNVKEQDEIGQLSRKFIWMTNALREKSEQLLDSHRKLQTTNQQLSKMNEMQSRFLSMVNHDLRAPITVVKGFLEVLAEEECSDEEKEKILRICRATMNRMTVMVNDLIDISSIGAGKFHVELKLTNLFPTIKSVFESFIVMAQSKSIVLTSDVPESDMKIMVDEHRIMQVVTNLVTNALKFTPKEGRIQLFAQIKNSEIEISIKDSGPGISKEYITRIFEKHFQIGEKKGGGYTGLGLGLFISKQIIDLHSGKIWATSEGDGKGTTFHFTIPIL